MHTKQYVLNCLEQSGVVGVIRTDNPEYLIEVAKSLSDGGVKFIEITLTVPGALDIIVSANSQLTGFDIFIGAGTVLDAETARAAILAGSQFVVGPNYNADMVRLCNRYGVVVISGALTPHEVLQAWEGGADVVKLFPANLGGAEYLKTIKEPLPQVRILPTKGINLETAESYIKAGAFAVGVGGALVNKKLLENRDCLTIKKNAQKFTQIVQAAKSNLL